MNLDTLFDDDIIHNTEYSVSVKASTPPVDTIEARTAEVTTTGAGDEVLNGVDRPLTWRQVVIASLDRLKLPENKRRGLLDHFNKAAASYHSITGSINYSEQTALLYYKDRLLKDCGYDIQITEFTTDTQGDFLVGGWKLIPPSTPGNEKPILPSASHHSTDAKAATITTGEPLGVLNGMGRAL